MVTLTLDWHEVLWYFAGGMSGSHLRWSVYEDMVNKVWPQCDEQERRCLWFIMRRDLGSWWRPDGWSGFEMATAHGEGDWKPLRGYVIDREKPDGKPVEYIMDETPWMYFRQVLARFDQENQWAVTMRAETDEEVEQSLCGLSKPVIISTPTLILSADKTRYGWMMDEPLVVRAYKWKDEYYIDWSRRCDPDRITKAERLEIPDNGTM